MAVCGCGHPEDQHHQGGCSSWERFGESCWCAGFEAVHPAISGWEWADIFEQAGIVRPEVVAVHWWDGHSPPLVVELSDGRWAVVRFERKPGSFRCSGSHVAAGRSALFWALTDEERARVTPRLKREQREAELVEADTRLVSTDDAVRVAAER